MARVLFNGANPLSTQSHFALNVIAVACAVALTTIPSLAQAKTVNVESPDKHINISLTDDNGRPEYQVKFNDNIVINAAYPFHFPLYPLSPHVNSSHC